MAVLETTVSPQAREKMKTDTKKVHLVAQELKLARVLAGNSKSSRDRALKNLTKWFKQRSETIPFTEDDFMRVWKGLFYSMWMSDKPLIQEECAENISKLVHLPTLSSSLLFFKAGLQTLCNEWFGIDQLRLDKFLMFTRRLLRQAFVVLKNNHFSRRSVEEFCDVITNSILNVDKKPPLGLFMHFTEIYLEELAKISKGQLHPDRLTDFLRPFIHKLATSNDGRDIAHIRKFIFTYLIRQHDLGLEYQEKYRAWKREGFPGSINSMQKVAVEQQSDDDQDDEENKALDPRAGRVDVNLPQLKFSPKQVSQALLDVKFDSKSTTKARKMITILSEQFQKLAQGVYPLGVKQITNPKGEDYDMSIRKAVNRLVKFDNKIMGRDKKRKKHDQDDGVAKKRFKSQEQNTMEELIRKSEEELFQDLKRKKSSQIKKAKTILLDEKVDCVFKRNSGTWVVFKTDEGDKEICLGDADVGETPKKRPSPDKNMSPAKKKSPNKNELQPVNLFKVPLLKDSELFPKSEWDEPLKPGEYELALPSKKYLEKLKKQQVNEQKSVQDLINDTIRRIKGKALKTPTNIVKRLSSVTSSSKKVKINTKLNQSQEIYEHVAQIKNSPGIPYDANKKPLKPLLKPTGSTPINPFYKQTRWF